MAIVINGSGTLTGLAVGGLPDATVDNGTVASGIAASKLTGALPAISGANLTGLSSFNPDGAVVFNESGANVDFRVESDGLTHALFVDGGTNRVGIGTGTPDTLLEIQGVASVGAGADESLQQWNVGSDNCKMEIKYLDGSSNRGFAIGPITENDFNIKTNNINRMKFTYDGKVGINTITPPERLSIHESSTGTGTYLPVAITGANHATGYGVGISFKTENGSPTQKAKAAIIAEGTGEGYNKTSLHIAMSNTNDTTTEVALANSVLEFTADGRGLSQFTAKAWANFNMVGTSAIRDSHNFSSLTDLGTGFAQVNYTNAMANTNYSAVASGDADNTWQGAGTHANVTATAYVRVYHVENGNTVDTALQSVLVFGD